MTKGASCRRQLSATVPWDTEYEPICEAGRPPVGLHVPAAFHWVLYSAWWPQHSSVCWAGTPIQVLSEIDVALLQHTCRSLCHCWSPLHYRWIYYDNDLFIVQPMDRPVHGNCWQKNICCLSSDILPFLLMNLNRVFLGNYYLLLLTYAVYQTLVIRCCNQQFSSTRRKSAMFLLPVVELTMPLNSSCSRFLTKLTNARKLRWFWAILNYIHSQKRPCFNFWL